MQRILLCVSLSALFLVNSGQHPGVKKGDELMAEALVLLDSARYEDALERSQQALHYFQRPANRDMRRTGEALMLLGSVFLEYGDFSGAQQQYEQALALLEQHAGKNHLLTAKALNGMGECLYRAGRYAEAQTYHHRALAIRESKLGSIHEQVADSYNNIGNCLVDAGRYTEALAMHQKTLSIRAQIFPENHPSLAASYNNIGNCFFLLEAHAEALPRLQKALRIRSGALGSDHPRTATLYNNLGNCFAALGQTEAALEHYEQALRIRHRHLGGQHTAVASTLENIGDLFLYSGDYVAALDYFRRAYHIQNAAREESSVAVASLLHKIGQCLEQEGDYEEALRAHLASARALLANFGQIHPSSAKLFSNIGNCYLGQDYPDVAEDYYRRALMVFQESYQAPHPDIARVYNNLGAAALAQKTYSEAQEWFGLAAQMLRACGQQGGAEMARTLKNQALANAGAGHWQTAFADLASAKEALAGQDPISELEVLSAQGKLLGERGLASADIGLLQEAADVLQQVLQRSDSLRLLITAPAARQRWASTQYPVLSIALRVHFMLWEKTGQDSHLHIAFDLAERGKSLHLLETLRKEQAERFAGVPDSLLEQERDLNWQLNRLEKERIAWAQVQSSEGIKDTDIAIGQIRQQLSELTAAIERSYPDYTRLKYARTTASLSDIRARCLQPDQALTEYFMTDSTLFAFVITRERFEGVRIPLNFPLVPWVAALRNSIQDYHAASGAAAEGHCQVYVQTAADLYHKIVAPLEAAGLAGKSQWLIVPDGILSYIPFEALLRRTPQNALHFKTHDYLLRDYCISYAYSATQLDDLLKRPLRPAAKAMMAFAPSFDYERDGLQPLRQNVAEAQAVSQLFGGLVKEGPAANKAAFLQEATQYRILLLATHGKAGSSIGDLSYLAFSSEAAEVPTDSRLYVRDLYQQRLPAELVALSACETNVGEYKAGEGVISLAKGFFHAGVRSIVATLWSVDDAKNTQLMHLFFTNIKEGMLKDKALMQAKLDFINSHPHDEAHPVYWAAAVTAGDMRAMSFGAGLRYLWLLCLPLVWLGWRRYAGRS